MLNMIIRKRRHSIVTVIIIRLVPYIHARDSGFFGSFFEVFRQELALFVEVISGALINVSMLYHRGGQARRTYNIN